LERLPAAAHDGNRVSRTTSAEPFIFVKGNIIERPMVEHGHDAYLTRAMLVPRANLMTRFATTLRATGPYVAIALTMPGGTVMLVSFWAFRHRQWFASHAHRALAVLTALVMLRKPSPRTLAPGRTGPSRTAEDGSLQAAC
jgi:hypothetical protein